MPRITENLEDYAELVNKAAGLPTHTGVRQLDGRVVEAPNSTLAIQEIEEDEEGTRYFEVTDRVRAIIEAEEVRGDRLTEAERNRLRSRTPERAEISDDARAR